MSSRPDSNKILNFQESTTILNTCTKKSLETYWIHHVHTLYELNKVVRGYCLQQTSEEHWRAHRSRCFNSNMRIQVRVHQCIIMLIPYLTKMYQVWILQWQKVFICLLHVELKKILFNGIQNLLIVFVWYIFLKRSCEWGVTLVDS